MYRSQLRLGVPLVLGAAWLLSWLDAGSSGAIFIAVTMGHVIAQQTYYTESFMWKRHSIHRSHVAFRR